MSLKHLSTRLMAPRIAPLPHRTIHSTTKRQTTHDQKNQEDKFHDRNILNPQRSEVSKTGTDDEVAGHPSAFDPSTTAPESEVAQSEAETKEQGKVSNPLNMSPGNREASDARPPLEGAPDKNVDRGVSSSRGGARKNREVNKPRS
ncbi:hypothetical protein BDV25DRAFT_138918 [Aspergillus avenaceus]|uniref:Uncharacterized protein n=1 Tax=Aspergillus avenaceus TaxID=36643 RepID=A0A5N6TYE1_ASPAV|nr:hypothetical protein BDV25DRAFT_138918 [Aspergillus avenaceus]